MDKGGEGTIPIDQQDNNDNDSDRVSQILHHLSNNEEVPSSLKRSKESLPSPDELATLLRQHPFFATPDDIEAQIAKDPTNLPPLLQGLADLKYSSDQDPKDLALSYKSDGLFQFKVGKYRIARALFTEALKYAEKCQDKDRDPELISSLYNNRGVCEFHVENYRSAFQDFKKAVKSKESCVYVKSLKKGVECCQKLGAWEEGVDLVAWVKDNFKDWEDEDKLWDKVKKGERQVLLSQHRKEVSAFSTTKKNAILLAKLQSSGIKFKSTDFLAKEETRVKIVDDIFHWPVGLFYPEFGQSDFIEEWNEHDKFRTHLEEMFVNNHPGWDIKGEYNVESIAVYPVQEENGTFLAKIQAQVNLDNSLAQVLREQSYTLPSNGIPGFILLSTSNPYYQAFLKQMASY